MPPRDAGWRARSPAIETAVGPTPDELAALVAATAAAITIGPVTTPRKPRRSRRPPTPPPRSQRPPLRVGRPARADGQVRDDPGLLASGAALGTALFQRTLPPPILVGDASTGGVDAPPVVKELTDALTTNNADSIRSAVSTGPYEKLAAELQQWDIKGVTSVETLATMQDGTRSATEIVIRAKTAPGIR